MKELLVIADQQGGKNSALIRAVQLQQTTGANITLLGFCHADIHSLSGTEYAKLSRNNLEKKLLLDRKQQLESSLKTLNINSKKITVQAIWSKHIAPAITAYCEKNKVQLVLKSAHNSSSVFHTSTDWQLIRECSAPVMITAQKSWKKKARIIAAVDLSTKTASKLKLNHSIMETAKALAAGLNSEIYACYVIKPPQALVDMDLIDARVYAKNTKEKLKNVIDGFCQKHGLDKEHMLIKQGRPERIIPSIANKLKVDAVVTGTVGRKGIKGKLLGNTAESILQNLYTDIIAIKP